MSQLFRQFSETIQTLTHGLSRLEQDAALLKVAPLAGREWYDLLLQKLAPQLKDDAFLVVAVVGGTNIGKSVVFNHLARSRASATSPLASGTKHPVCLVPPGFADRHDLPAIFPGFELRRWDSATQSLEDHDAHLLFWRESPETAENLLVLDTPDVDSDARINWERADQVRRCADILIAVLTQQKYNDAQVKKFFRQAAQEDKAVVIVFNQCELPDDEAYWPLWLQTFCGETGIRPDILYVAPKDRRAAEENRLPFYERPWPVPADAVNPAGSGDGGKVRYDNAVRSPAEDLSRFRFAEVKLRTLRGSLQQIVHPTDGLPTWLAELRDRSREFHAASTRLSSEEVARVADWPNIPANLFVDEIRNWWLSQQSDLARRITGAYSTVTKGILWPVRKARDYFQGEPPPPLDLYRDREWSAVMNAVEQVFEKLEFMSESGNELLRPHFAELMAGASRQKLIDELKSAHARVNLAGELQRIVSTEMNRFREENPQQFQLVRNVNQLTAFARPVISAALFALGFGPAGELIAPAASHLIVHFAGEVAANVAGGGAVAAAGAVGAQVAGGGVNLIQARIQQLPLRFMERRGRWLADILKQHLLGTLPDELAKAAAVPQSDAFRQVERQLETLRKQLATLQPANA